jgi:hypothetical protein
MHIKRNSLVHAVHPSILSAQLRLRRPPAQRRASEDVASPRQWRSHGHQCHPCPTFESSAVESASTSGTIAHCSKRWRASSMSIFCWHIRPRASRIRARAGKAPSSSERSSPRAQSLRAPSTSPHKNLSSAAILRLSTAPSSWTRRPCFNACLTATEARRMTAPLYCPDRCTIATVASAYASRGRVKKYP